MSAIHNLLLTKVYAALALEKLAYNNTRNQNLIAESGAIKSLENV